MPHNFNYTDTARNFTARLPFLSFVMTQIIFWVIAETLLAIMLNLFLSAVNETYPLPFKIHITQNLLIGFMLGALYGTLMGIIDYCFDKQYFRRKSLGIMLFMKGAISLLVFVLLFALVRSVFFKIILKPYLPSEGVNFGDQFWKFWFLLFLIYNSAMNLIINFTNQINRKFGPGILLPLLMGKYRHPQEEERIFMFMDLKSSTTIAEDLGHIKYSSFIRDSFMDINLMLNKFGAGVYQYVGDEIVIIWTIRAGLKNMACIKFFFACEEQFKNRSSYYLENYKLVPKFKAGVHMGKITTVEIGEIKRDLAYHGDTINTTARIQSICNEHNKYLLASKFLFDNIGSDENYKTQSLGLIQLKGKLHPVEIISIEKF